MSATAIRKLILTGVCAMVFSAEAFADVAWWTSKVDKIMTDDTNFGLCMARLAVNPKTELPGCGDHWVTFSCSGDFNSKQLGYLKMDAASMAMALDKTVLVRADDSRLHNGYCFVMRIDVLK